MGSYPDGCHLNYYIVLKCGKSFLIAFQKMWNYPHSQSCLRSLGQHIHLKIQLPLHSGWISYAAIKGVMAVLCSIFLKINLCKRYHLMQGHLKISFQSGKYDLFSKTVTSIAPIDIGLMSGCQKFWNSHPVGKSLNGIAKVKNVIYGSSFFKYELPVFG